VSPVWLDGLQLHAFTHFFVQCRFQSPRGGEGKVLSFDLIDKDGGEIRVTAWGDQADIVNDTVQVAVRVCRP